jgi:hypothetical protein
MIFDAYEAIGEKNNRNAEVSKRNMLKWRASGSNVDADSEKSVSMTQSVISSKESSTNPQHGALIGQK